MKKKIAVLPGDGIGPEVIEQAIKVLDAIGDRFNHQFEYCFADVGGVAIDKTGNPLPDETLETCLNTDAVLFGAIGHPKFDNDPSLKVRPEQGLLRMRKELGLFANIRPVTTYKKLLHLSPLKEDKVAGVDLVIYRELTSGIYFGERGTSENSAFDTCFYTVEEIERIAHAAFQAAMKRRKILTLVDKANVLDTSRLWRSRVQKMAAEYPEVTLNFMYVDNAAMQLIQYPKQFDVVLTSNMFGDILSDEASVLTGSMGLLPSASIGLKTSVFEPIHGSFPQAAGEDVANPMATILSAAMMLDEFGLQKEARIIRTTIKHVLEKGIGTPELNARITLSCSQVGDMLAHLIAEDISLDIGEDRLAEKISTII